MPTNSPRYSSFAEMFTSQFYPQFYPQNLNQKTNNRRSSTSSSPSPPFPKTTARPPISPEDALRTIFVAILIALFALPFLDYALELALLFVGVLAPAWASFKSLERRAGVKKDEDDVVVELLDSDGDGADYNDTREHIVKDPRAVLIARSWQAYWILAALLYAMEKMMILPLLGRLLPSSAYNAMLLAGLVWLTRDNATNAKRIYDEFVKITFIGVEDGVDGGVHWVKTKLDILCQQIVVLVHDGLTPIVKQLKQAGLDTEQQETSNAKKKVVRGR